MMTEYQMKSDTQDEAPVSLTAVAVCKRLLAEPTEAISQILLHVEETADKDEENLSPFGETEDDFDDDDLSEDDSSDMENLSGDGDSSDDDTWTVLKRCIMSRSHQTDPDSFNDDSDKSEQMSVPFASRMRINPDPKNALSEIIERTGSIQKLLLDNVYGQDHAVNAFSAGYFQAELSSLTQNAGEKPRAVFLFAGPPGTGKTFLSEQAAKALNLPFRRFDMSEYSDKEANFEFCGSDKVYKNGSAGNVIMFNRMEVNNLVRISQREIQKQIDAIAQKTKIKIEYDEKLPYAILFSEGGNADARTVRGKSCNFFYDEIYELFRLLNSEGNRFDVKSIKSIRFELQSFTDPAISKLFERGSVQTHDKLLRL